MSREAAGRSGGRGHEPLLARGTGAEERAAPLPTPAERALEAVSAAERSVAAAACARDAVRAAHEARDVDRWAEQRSGLTARVLGAERAVERARGRLRAGGAEAAAAVARLDAAAHQLAGLEASLGAAAVAPSGGAPAGGAPFAQEAALLALLAAPLTGPAAEGYARKEAAVRELLGRLVPAESLRLAARLRRAHVSDPLVRAFGGFTADRRERLLAFLDDSSRRAWQERERDLRPTPQSGAVRAMGPAPWSSSGVPPSAKLARPPALSAPVLLPAPASAPSSSAPELLPASASSSSAPELLPAAASAPLSSSVAPVLFAASGPAPAMPSATQPASLAARARATAPAASSAAPAAAAAPLSPEDAARREQMLAALPLVTARWRALGGALLSPAEAPAGPPLDAFAAGAYERLLADERDLEPVRIAVAGPGREPYAPALDEARRAAAADRPHLAQLQRELAYLASGGDLSYAATSILAAHARLGPRGKDAVARLAPLAIDPLAAYIAGDAGAHGIRIRRSQLEAEGVELVSAVWRVYAGGSDRAEGCRTLLATLHAGATAAPAAPAEITDAPAVREEAKALSAAIASAVARAGRGGRLPLRELAVLDALVGKATPRARELVLADAAVMGPLARTLAPALARALLERLDTVEELYRALCPADPRAQAPRLAPGMPAKRPLELGEGSPAYRALRAWLEARPGAGNLALRRRLLEHTRLKTEVIDRLAAAPQRLVYRLVARGTAEPTAEDRVHEAAERSDGAALITALRDLAAADPRRLAELERDPVFRRSAERFTAPVLIGGLPLRPWELCQALWGRAPASADPAAAGLAQVNLTGDERPLTADERFTLDAELFDPALADLHAQVIAPPRRDSMVALISRQQEQQVQAVLDRLRVFERRAAEPRLRDLLQRDRVVAGAELARRFGRRFGTDLRTWIYQHAGPHVRSGVARVLGTEQGAAVGTFGGEAVGAGEVRPGRMSMQQALRETLAGEWTLSEWCSVASRQLARGIEAGDRAAVVAAWEQFAPHAAGAAPELERLTGIRARPLDLMRNAYREHAGHLEANLAAKFPPPVRAELEERLGLAAAAEDAAEDATRRGPAARAEERFATPARLLWQAIEALRADSPRAEYTALGALLRLQYGLPHLGDAPGAREDGAREEQPVQSFGGYYRRHRGASPDGHAEAALVALRGARAVPLSEARTLLGLPAATAPAREALAIDERNEHLVRAEFTVEVARRRAGQIWQVLRESGRLELIETQLYGDCNDEEQRLIRIAFRELSGGFDLAFYVRRAMDARAAKQAAAASGDGAPGAAASLDEQALAAEPGAGGDTLRVRGTQTELERALATATTGEIDALAQLRTAAARGDSDQVFRVLDETSPAQRAAILDDGALIGRLRALGQWQWERCFKVLTGQADLADRLYSRSHGDHSWTERTFGGTHEAGMEEDLRAHIRRLRVSIDRAVRAELAARDRQPPPHEIDAQIRRRVLDACGAAATHPSVQAILRAELDAAELRKLDTQLVTAGEPADWTVAGGAGAKQILAEIRGMAAPERARRLADPQYLRLLGARLSGAEYRDALNALSATSDADLAHGGGGLARLDAASRTGAQLSGADSDGRRTLRALAELSPDEQHRLAADPHLQLQVLAALPEADRALARELLAAPADAGGDRAALLARQAAGRLRVAARGSWRELLVAAVEVYKLDFAAGFARHGEGGPRGGGAAVPAAEAAALRGRIWEAAREAVQAHAAAHAAHPRQKTKDAVTAPQMLAVIRAAARGEADPSDALLRENVYTLDEQDSAPPASDGAAASLAQHVRPADHQTDAAGLAAALRSASDRHVATQWTSIAQLPAGGGETLQQRYRAFSAADEAADAARAAGRTEDPAVRTAHAARRRFLECQIRIAQALEAELLPYMGDDRAATRAADGERLSGRDNKRYNDLAQIILERIPRLPPEIVGEAIGAAPRHAWLLRSDVRRHVGEVAARDERWLRHRGAQADGAEVAQDEREVLDEEQARLGRAHAQAITDGAVSADEEDRYQRGYEAVDRAADAHRAAVEAAAGWASLLVGTVLTIAATVLTGGLATGPVAMLALAGATAALSATAKSLVMERVLDGEWDRQDAAELIAREVVTGIVTMGTTHYAQRLLSAVAGATTIGRQGAAVRQVLRRPPRLYQALAHEAAEEVASETMSSLVEAGLAAIDPAHWMHGYEEGARQAQEAALAQLAKTGARAKEAALTALFTSVAGRATGKLRRGGRGAGGGAGGALDVPAREKQRVDVLRNLREVLGDPGEKLVEALIQWGMSQDGPIDWSRAPADLLRGWLQEMGEAGTEVHTGTVSRAARRARAQADLARAGGRLTEGERADFAAMQESALDSDVYVSVSGYLDVRERVIAQGLHVTQELYGVRLSAAQRAAFSAWVRQAATPEALLERAYTDPRSLPEVMSAVAEAAPAAVPAAEGGAESDEGDTAGPSDTKTDEAVGEAAGATSASAAGAAESRGPSLPSGLGAQIAAAVEGARYAGEGVFQLETGGQLVSVRIQRTHGSLAVTSGPAGSTIAVPRGLSAPDFERAVIAKLVEIRDAHRAGAGQGGSSAEADAATEVDRRGAELAEAVGAARYIGAGSFELQAGPRAVSVEVRRAPGASVIRREGGSVVIQLDSKLAGPQLERVFVALATEVAHQELRIARGQRAAAESSLGEHGTGARLSPADMGAIAELRVVRRQRDELSARGADASQAACEVAVLEERLGLIDDSPASEQRRRAVEAQLAVQRDAGRRARAAHDLNGTKGHPGIDLHTHFTGVVKTEVFRDRAARAVGKNPNSWLPLLAKISELKGEAFRHETSADGEILRRATSGDAIALANVAQAQVEKLVKKARAAAGDSQEVANEHMSAAEQVARTACITALQATQQTDFNSAYEIRDQLIKETFGSAGAKPPDMQARYDDFIREAVLQLAREGIGYSEQSTGLRKLSGVLSPRHIERVIADLVREGRLLPGQIDIRMLGMTQTAYFGERDAGLPPVRQVNRDNLGSDLDQIERQIREPGTVGQDVGGPEFYRWDDKGVGMHIEGYLCLLTESRRTGSPMVHRPHVGEGAIDTTQGRPFHTDKDRIIKDGELAHYERARNNIEQFLRALEELQRRGLLDPTSVIVRLGHVTHATPSQVARMRTFGVYAEVNLGSNVASASLNQTIGVDGPRSEVEQFDDHSLASLIYYGVPVAVSADSGPVMSTSLREEYERARFIIEEVLAGSRTIRVRAEDARRPDGSYRGRPSSHGPDEYELSISDLTPEERERFLRGYEKLYADVERYYRARPKPRGSPSNTVGAPSPMAGAHHSDVARAHGLVPTMGTALHEGTLADVERAAAAYRNTGYEVTEDLREGARLVVRVRARDGSFATTLHAWPDVADDEQLARWIPDTAHGERGDS